MPRTYGPIYDVRQVQSPQPAPRGPQLSSALSTSSAPFAVPRSDGSTVIPWTSETTQPEGVDKRTYARGVAFAPHQELIAGVRTQPTVQKYQRTAGWKQFYNHVPVVMPQPGAPPAIPSSLFQPTNLQRESWSQTVGGGDWIWPTNFDGTWGHAAELIQPNPGGASQAAQPRWTRTGNYPRASTMPNQFQPTQSGGNPLSP